MVKIGFGRRPRPGHIEDLIGTTLLFRAERELPPLRLIEDFIYNSVPVRVKWNLPANYVVREMVHVVGWIKAFLEVESRELKNKFDNQEKSYESMLFVNNAFSAIDLKIRLKTTAVQGYTEYCVSIIKTGRDEYICVE